MSRSFGKSELLAVIRQRLKNAPPLPPPKEQQPRTVRAEPLAEEPRRIGHYGVVRRAESAIPRKPATKLARLNPPKQPFPITTHRIDDVSLWLIQPGAERREAWL